MMEVYPASLPCPQFMSYAPTERRVLGDASRPRFARYAQIDESASEQVTFPPMTAEQYTEFRRWWRDDLTLGGQWFDATWPSPRGKTPTTYRFSSAPQYVFLGGSNGGYWRISASLDVRGRYYAPSEGILWVGGVSWDADVSWI